MIRQDIYYTRYLKGPSDFGNISIMQEHCVQDLCLGNYISPVSLFPTVAFTFQLHPVLDC